jgi:hypothetical protein
MTRGASQLGERVRKGDLRKRRWHISICPRHCGYGISGTSPAETGFNSPRQLLQALFGREYEADLPTLIGIGFCHGRRRSALKG